MTSHFSVLICKLLGVVSRFLGGKNLATSVEICFFTRKEEQIQSTSHENGFQCRGPYCKTQFQELDDLGCLAGVTPSKIAFST